MFLLKPLPEFSVWLDGLADVTVRSVVVARLKRLELGLMGTLRLQEKGCQNCAFIWAQDGVSISLNAERN